MARDSIYIANTSGFANVKGTEYSFRKGITRVREGHPLLKACPLFFEPADKDIEYDVEQATAAPAERRGA